MKFKTLLAIFLFTSTLSASAPASVKISPEGFIYQHRPTVHISVHIEKDAANRAAVLELASEDFYSRSEFEVPGEDAPVNCSFDIRGLVPGEYTAYLTLVRQGAKNFVAQSNQVTVLY